VSYVCRPGNADERAMPDADDVARVLREIRYVQSTSGPR